MADNIHAVSDAPVDELDGDVLSKIASVQQQIFGASDIVAKLVPVPEWGKDKSDPTGERDLHIEIRAADVVKRSAYFKTLQEIAPDGDISKVPVEEMYPLIVSLNAYLAVYDDTITGDIEDKWQPGEGAKLFTQKHCKMLATRNAEIIERLASVAQDMSGMGASDEKDAFLSTLI